jgi:hypothetical protein
MIKENYLLKLNEFVNRINQENLSSEEIKTMLEEAPKIECYVWEERKPFEELIKMAKEYVELEKIFNDQIGYLYGSEEGKERWNQLRSYFTELQIDLRDGKTSLLDLKYKTKYSQ